VKRSGYQFGIMLERSDKWIPGHKMYRVFSGVVHGPWMFSRLDAFFSWLIAWFKHRSKFYD